jgi:hypothetical protein
MAKYSKKVMGKEVGDGALYAPPHTMTGKDIGPKEAMLAVSRPPDPNTLAANQYTCNTRSPRVSFGDPGKDNVKTSGIKIRGTGAATKGVMARGPMA